MKVLHTADWHLGKKLEGEDRVEEHQQFLDWLLVVLNEQQVDVLLIAGDVFDTGMPSNQSLKQYYSFLWQVKNTCCKHVIIVGGNHDSVSTLNAPKEILKHLDIHIIGGVPEHFEEQLIEIKNKVGEVELLICAVPFLRDKDIKLSMAGETLDEKEWRIKQAVVEYYERFVPFVQPYQTKQIPIIATGHLFAAGAVATPESEKDIFVGNLGQIGAEQFPKAFNYVALGHLHKPQMVNKNPNIRYSGSPIALSFSENNDPKQVLILTIDKTGVNNIETISIPGLRPLIRIEGAFEVVLAKLMNLELAYESKWDAWVEIQVKTEGFIPDLYEQLMAVKPSFVSELFIRQIKVRAKKDIEDDELEMWHLSDLTPIDVFKQKMSVEQLEGESGEQLMRTFEEALILFQSKQTEVE